MTTALIRLKEYFKEIYSRNSVYINPAVKYVISLFVLLIMKHYIGYNSTLSNPVVLILVSAICCIMPVNLIVIVYTLLIVANLAGLSTEAALVSLILFILMYVLYFRFAPKYGFVMLLMPILCFIRLPYLMPLILGMATGPASIIAMIFGLMTFFVMKFGSDELITIENAKSSSAAEKMNSFLTKVISDKEVIMLMIAFALTMLVVYGIRRLTINYAVTIGIIVGGAVDAIIILCALYVMDIDAVFQIWVTLVFSIISIILAIVLQNFIIAVDYNRTEFAQFEDDDYYYYVKAIPKIKVTASDVKVKHINTKKSRR